MSEPKIFTDAQVAKTKEDLIAVGEAMQRFGDAFARAYAPAVRRVMEAMRPLIEFANSPAGQAIIAEHRRREALGLNLVAGCHCLCVVRHPERQVCLGEFPSRETVHVRIGGMHVPMCPPCSVA